jgi:uncharacterized phage-associated protein
MNELANSAISATDIAKYFLYRSIDDGELISPLKMQKLVYYAYAWVPVSDGKRLFNEAIEAWTNGPVVLSLYQNLKDYGSAPIGQDFLASSDLEKLAMPVNRFGKDIADTLDWVYQEYMTKTAFELVLSTHSEKPLLEARKGLAATDKSNKPISDDVIREEYGQD